MKKLLLIGSAALLCTAIAAWRIGAQQAKPSPAAQAKCDLGGGKSVTVDYSSPRMKGRKIFGGLVPYGEVWRTGANEATTFVTNSPLTVGGKQVPAGNYTLFTVPDKDKWVLIISKKTGEWGIPYPGANSDLLRVDMKTGATPSAVENFTISFDKAAAGCTLRIEWENTRATIDIMPM